MFNPSAPENELADKLAKQVESWRQIREVEGIPVHIDTDDTAPVLRFIEYLGSAAKKSNKRS